MSRVSHDTAPRPSILIRSLPLDDHERATLDAAAGDTVRVIVDDPAAPHPLDGIDAVAGAVTPDELAAFPNLRWIHLWSAGADHILPALASRPDIVLTASLGNGAQSLAESALWSMLHLARGGWQWADAQREHRWDRRHNLELHGLTLGLIGLGRSGAHLAGIARAMGMRVIATRRTPGDDDRVDAVYPPERVAELMAESDVVVITAPLTAETRGMIAETELRALRPSALLVNVSRGEITDQGALERALVERWFAGAALDAHHVEPLPAESPLWDLPHVIVTPHNAATSLASKARAIATLVDNLPRFGAGEPLLHTVDRDAGY